MDDGGWGGRGWVAGQRERGGGWQGMQAARSAQQYLPIGFPSATVRPCPPRTLPTLPSRQAVCSAYFHNAAKFKGVGE